MTNIQNVKGLAALEAKLKKNTDQIIKGLRKGLFRAGLFIQRESQKLVPVDTGALRASANTRIEGTGAESEVIVSYSTDYGVYVHENLEARHKPGKTAKYLETPLREKRQRLEKIVIEAIEEDIT